MQKYLTRTYLSYYRDLENNSINYGLWLGADIGATNRTLSFVALGLTAIHVLFKAVKMGQPDLPREVDYSEMPGELRK